MTSNNKNWDWLVPGLPALCESKLIYYYITPFESKSLCVTCFLFLLYFSVFSLSQILFEMGVLKTAVSRNCGLSWPISYEGCVNLAPIEHCAPFGGGQDIVKMNTYSISSSEWFVASGSSLLRVAKMNKSQNVNIKNVQTQQNKLILIYI